MDKPAKCINVLTTSSSSKKLSRQMLLQWIYDSIGQKVLKVESLCSGAIYCQFMNILFPGLISSSKIKLEATQEYEFQANLKQLQLAFKAVGCDKLVPIEKLIKGRFQDNFEFLEWFHRFFEANCDPNYMMQETKMFPYSYAANKKLASSVAATAATDMTFLCSSTPRQLKKREIEIKAEYCDLGETADQLEREKEFYLNKLQNIKMICNAALASAAPEDKKTHLVKKMLAIIGDDDDDKREVEGVEDEDETY